MIWGYPKSEGGILYSKEKLLEMLSSKKASVRYEACEWIRVSQESSPRIIKALEKVSRDSDEEVAERATLALQADVHHQMAVKMGMIEPDKTGENEYVLSRDIYDRNTELKHSGLGIASFGISILPLLSCIYFIFFEEGDIQDGMSIIGYCLCFGNPFVSLVSLLLGIGGLLQKDREKIFAILGVVISALIIVLYIYIFSR